MQNKILVSLAAASLLIIPMLFWKDILLVSPLFFGYRGSDLFGIYTASLDGRNFRPIILDAKRELTHARVSPNGKQLTFTRYNRVVKDGLCEETGSGYLNTEIVVAAIDGSRQNSIERAGAEILNANSSWIDDDSIIYIHNSDLKSLPEFRVYHLSSRTTSRVPTKAGLAVSDPTCIGQTLVFPVIPMTGDKNCCGLWTMSIDGNNLKQLTNPAAETSDEKLDFKLGDYDPCLSPDGQAVTFMRYFGGSDWRIFTANLKDGTERLLTAPGVPSGIPKWSGDGNSIIFVCWDKTKLENIGLYTMTASGSKRLKVPLPGGYLYTHPSFFPGNGSSRNATIMFSARKVPGITGEAHN